MNGMIEIHDFTERYLEDAAAIALRLWEAAIPGMPVEMRTRIYRYLVRYYYIPGSPLSLRAMENGKLCAFLLGAPASEIGSEHADKWMAGQLNGTDESVFFQEYKAYIDRNRSQEYLHAAANEASLLLFASIRRGAGKKLLEEFEKRCRSHGMTSIILWTDETCDFDYYHRNGFTEAAKFPADPTICDLKLTTYLFRKSVK